MHFRPLRASLIFTFLLGLILVPGVSAARAIAPAPSWHSFQASGHGSAVGHMIDTASLPNVQGADVNATSAPSSAEVKPAPAQASPALTPPPNVVNVPAPTTTDSSAKAGISQQKGAGGDPDVNGTGGTNNYLETVVGQLSIYGRGGALQQQSTYQSWFGVNSTFYDPMSVWDNTGSRVIFSILQSGAKVVWLSVAQQANAKGSYCNYSVPAPANRDFDHLGVDSDGIYVSVNVLAPGSPTQVVGNELYYFNRTALETCQPVQYTDWTNLTNPDGTIAEAITPARQDTSTQGVEYMVNSYPAGGCQLTLWTLTNTDNLSNTSIPTECYSPPPAAKQKGSSALIYSGGDCSLTQASFVNGLLTVATPGSYDWGDGNGQVGIVEWFVINAGAGTLANQGAFGTKGDWLFYPSAITTQNGNMLFVYNASGSSIYPSVWYVTQSMTNAVALANGVSYMGTSGVSGWGYYQSAWPDVNSGFPNDVWITGEYAKATSAWGTKFDLVNS